MSTKAAFIAAVGTGMPYGREISFERTSGNILTATAHGLTTGAGPFKVRNPAGDAPSGITAAVRASTFATCTSVIATDAITVNGTVYTYIATPAAEGDIDVGDTDCESLENLCMAINGEDAPGAANYFAGTAPDTAVNAYIQSSGANGGAAVVVFESASWDATTGNAIGVSSADGTIVVDNATMEGGVDGTDYYIIRLSANTFSLATSRANAHAGTAVTLADAGTGLSFLVSTVDTIAEQLEDLLTEHVLVGAADRSFRTARFWNTMIAMNGQNYSD